MTVFPARKAQRSLRTILVVWFLVFAIAPLAFLTGFSIVRYEKAIEHELGHRLEGNAREVATMLSEFRSGLQQHRDRQISDPGFFYNLATNQVDELVAIGRNWIRGDLSGELTFFSRNGRMLVSLSRVASGEIHEYNPPTGSGIFISDENLAKIKDQSEYTFVETNSTGKISLILLSKIVNPAGKMGGYVEQVIAIDQDFLASIKNRMNVELVLIRKNGAVVVSTHPDFYDYQKNFFFNYIQASSSSSFDLNVRGDPFQFIMYPLRWGKTDLFIAIGASKSDAQAALKGVNYAFYTVAGAVAIFLIVIILIITNNILRPLQDLVRAAQEIPGSDHLIEIPIESDTEIGLLTGSFNDMSRQIVLARAELKAKIRELEVANREIRDTQTRLVHSSKMSSLGQLVAGVAHELNNPIGFIYSNMAHLRDYSDKLIKLAEAAEANPQMVPEMSKQFELDYIKSDLPKLIASCEDGARRLRDIVTGLRNFSRLEEAKLKELDINEAIDNTLTLLSGEIKNRIEIHKQYSELPKVECYASQMNQVFMNILSNAVQAIKGNGEIWITTKKAGKRQGKEMISILVQDSGEGIDPRNMDKIFDPFFSTKDVGQGTGLGLSISYGIVQSHGGDIQVKSKPGTGTEFTVTIPTKTDEVRA